MPTIPPTYIPYSFVENIFPVFPHSCVLPPAAFKPTIPPTAPFPETFADETQPIIVPRFVPAKEPTLYSPSISALTNLRFSITPILSTKANSPTLLAFCLICILLIWYFPPS